jgi:malto-oligosyltrehalose synthase
MTSRPVPRATLRLQFHRGFTFADAKALVPYFEALGVSHIYASPIMTARRGSMHGYDVVDPTHVSPELGGEEALKRLVDALRGSGMGLIADIVPNHMAASVDNAWWADVLRHGRDSRYACFFDIDWETEDAALCGKIFLPVLGKPLEEALAGGEIFAERRGEQDVLRYGGLLLPAQGTDPHRQAYRLGWWRTAGDRINWRRFFDINELVCLRMENEEAFEAVHATIARLYAEGIVDGVRVDHIDGLTDPKAYCHKLRRRLDPRQPDRPYLVVEKILLNGESLPASWGCDGTTGYDFMDEVSALQHDPAAEKVLASAWAEFSGRSADFRSEEIAARREIIARSFTAPLEACAAAFERLARGEPFASDLTRPALRRGLIELLAHFPVYRSYGTPSERPAEDRPFLDRAAHEARHDCLPGDRWIVDRLHGWMCTPCSDARPIVRFQQLSAPVAAKAVEDTAFYRYGRLLSRNDVGFDSGCFGLSPVEFHARMQRRAASYPHSLLATATHDHKRGEDVRARLAVLSEMPWDWARHCRDWLICIEPLRNGEQPCAGDIVRLFQTIVGAWPLELALDDSVGRAAFAERLTRWQQKALREAKLTSDWAEPNEAYESAAQGLLAALLVDSRVPGLLAAIHALVQEIAPAGSLNGLAQLLLKLTVPGVPDIYQGSDRWDFSLVDPDNRSLVDYAPRQAAVAPKSMAALMDDWRSGIVKQAIIERVLALRRAQPQLFDRGCYEPLVVEGALSAHVVAFLRRHDDEAVLVIVPRLTKRLLATSDALLLDANLWRDTAIRLPPDLPLHDVLADFPRELDTRNATLKYILQPLPIALFSTTGGF